MASKELMDAVMVEKTRLKAACGELTMRSAGNLAQFVENQGLIALVHMNQFSTMMLRCEFTVFMAMSAEKKFMEEHEYFRRLINQVRFEVKQLEASLEIVVDKDGRCHKSNRPKLLRPGSNNLPN